MANERKSRRGEAAGDRKPAAKKAPAAAGHARGGGLFDLDSEQSARLLIFGAVALVVAVAAGFLIFGYYYTVIRPRNRTVLQVADQKVSYVAMKRRMSYEFLQNTTYQSQQGVQLLPTATFQTLMNELTKITQAGPKLGINVDTAEEDDKLRVKLSVPANPDQRQFADALRKALDSSGLNELEYRRIVTADLYNTKILAKFKADAPATAVQAKLALITTHTEDAAKQAIARVSAGEDFSEVAKSVSKETDVQTTGGVKDYATKEAMTLAYRDFVFSADIGSVSAPLVSDASSSGSTQGQGSVVTYYVVKVIDRSDQPLTDAQKSQLAAQQLPDWLKATQDEMRANGTLKEDWDQTSQADALLAISGGVTAKLAAQQLQKQQDQQRSQDARSTTVAQLTASPQAAETPSPEGTAAVPTSAQGQGASPVATGTNGQ
jgi:parvulin-like peptidyl-prolyl cis-trans isomerase-like protein